MPALLVKAVSPKQGSAEGGQPVTISGSGFAHVTQVLLGGVPAEKFSIQTRAKIIAVTPPGTVGSAVSIVVQTPFGDSPQSIRRYTYAPSITSVAPHNGPTAGGTTVSVTGGGFALGRGTIFKFAGTSGSEVNCTSSTECTVRSPRHAAATVDLTAWIGKVVSAKVPADRFQFVP
jgi:hypothetical protein